MRTRVDDAEIIGSRPERNQLEGLPLFPDAVPEAPAVEVVPRAQTGASAQTKAPASTRPPTDREQAIQRLKDAVLEPLLARAVARKDRFESPGVTADDVVQLAKGNHWSPLLGSGQRAWSWVGPWLASLAREDQLREYRVADQVVRRRSIRPGAHGNLQIVYLHPTDHRVCGRAACA